MILEPREEVPLLETFPNPHPTQDLVVTFECGEWTSRCPKTGAPDFGTLAIVYAPRAYILESKSLKLWVVSYREVRAFWEQLTGDLVEILYGVLEPKWVRVAMTMKTRGGIDMTVESTLPVDDDKDV